MYPTHPVLDGIAELGDDLRKLEVESTALRRLAPRVVTALRELGVVRLLQPLRHGGAEVDPRVFTEAVHALSQTSGSAGWVAGVVGVNTWHVGLFDAVTQAEVWGPDRDAWICSAYGAGGLAERVPGGHLLRGRWSFSSGSDDCGWALLGGVADVGGGGPEFRHFLLPRDDFQVVDVWDPSGLAGTGSNDIVVTEAFVPDRRSLSIADTMERNVPGREVNPGPLFALPWFAVLLGSAVVPLVGMAAAALDEALAGHRATYVADPHALPGDLTLARLAEASASVDIARDVLLRNVGELYDTASAGTAPTLAQRMRSKRDHIVAVRMAVSAVDAAYRSGGPAAIAECSPLQQLWRDVHAGEHHAMNLPDGSLPAYGRYLVAGESALTPAAWPF
jgi:3-hydroxy-9,10-secoandrosta-1,3,5(10)-triene-9,17-dione monooxygenase